MPRRKGCVGKLMFRFDNSVFNRVAKFTLNLVPQL